MKKTLYVSRPLINTEPFIDWAKSQGFTQTLKAENLHVTVAFSREEVEWEEISPKTGSIAVAGGTRTVSSLGDDGAVVLKFKSDFLPKRWQEFKDAGASWDYESYQPHVSITYDGSGVDLESIEPYTGELVLGAEVFSELDLDWMSKEKEE